MKKSFQLCKKTSSVILNYVFSMILTKGPKNCSSMSRETGTSAKKLYKFHENASSNSETIKKSLIKTVTKYAIGPRKKALIIDPTSISKLFASKIEGLAYDFNSIIKTTSRCISFVAAAWTNGKITIPLDLLFWHNKKNVLPEKYKKKSELAMELILRLIGVVEIDYAVLDGAFASLLMIDFFIQHNIDFVMRMPKNRVVITKDGTKAQLRNHPALKLIRNERCKTVCAYYKGHWCYFTAHKRKNKRGSAEVVFIVSSLNVSPKEQAEFYDIRWEIEKVFRTVKQSLGVGNCQSVSLEKQKAHILATFLAYTSLMEEKIRKRKKSPEEILTPIRWQKNAHALSGLTFLEQTIMA